MRSNTKWIFTTAFTICAISGSALALSTCPPMETNEVVLDGEPLLFRCGVGEQNEQAPAEQQASPVIDVVFVLDTTGSMGGLLEGAKQKIWSIANTIAQAQNTPIVRFGLVGYRDRGDEYVTTITQLTEDLDTVYADLMGYQARGGGDTPESVNEALYTAVERFDWTQEVGSLKLIYLVGDAPPKMEYKDDVKYQASCRMAYEQGININTIQCGSLNGTQAIWQEIAQLANGAYAAIQQDGGVVAISTPYDEQIASLDLAISSSMVDYGSEETKMAQSVKRNRSALIAHEASDEAAADRAMYNYSDAGVANRFGEQELINDIITGAVAIEDVEKSELPKDLQALSDEDLKAEIVSRKEQRLKWDQEIKELAGKRSAYLLANKPASAMDGFDQKVLEALVEQGARVGIEFVNDSETKPENADEKAADEPVNDGKEEAKESKED